MDVRAGLDAPCDPDALFALVDDLSYYPQWLDLVHRADAVADSEPPAWIVDLRARLGPLARSKRLRMVRSEHDVIARHAVFTRHEGDGRRHSPWVLRVDVAATAGASSLRMQLHYGGALWTGGVLERALAEQISSGRERLSSLVRPTQ